MAGAVSQNNDDKLSPDEAQSVADYLRSKLSQVGPSDPNQDSGAATGGNAGSDKGISEPTSLPDPNAQASLVPMIAAAAVPTISSALGLSGPSAPPPAPIDTSDSVRQAIGQKYGFGPGLDSSAMAAALQKAQQNIGQANMQEGANDIGWALGRHQGPVNDPYFAQMRAQAMQPVQNIATLRQAKLQDLAAGSQMASNDPSSTVSQSVQDAYIRLGFPADSVRQLSADDLKQVQSPAELKAKLDENLLSRQMMNNMRMTNVNQQQAKLEETLAGNLKKDLDPDAARTGNFGQISQKLLSAQRLQTLATDFNGNPRNLNSSQMEELGIGLANMLGNGQVSDSRVKALVPQTAQGNKEKFMQWLTNEPTGTNQQAFVQNMLDTISREAGLANTQMNQIRVQRLPAHSVMKRMFPDTYNAILGGYGIGPDEKPMAQVAPQIPGGAPPAGQDSHIAQYAQENGLSYSQANSILRRRGYNGGQ